MNILKKIKNLIYFLVSAEFRQQHKLNRERNRLMNLQRFLPTETLLDGTRIKIPDSASFLSTYDEMFKKEIYKFNCSTTHPLIIDCGANIGLSVVYFKKIFPNSKIIAFEPDPKIFEVLKYNVTAFGYKDVELFNKALWSEEKELDFFMEGADSGRISNDDKTGAVTKIKSTRLSTFLNQKVDLLKIDIEGAEYEVLKECSSFLININKLFVEYHSFAEQEQHLEEILSILKSAGFRYYIQHIGVFSQHPFVSVHTYSGMDLQLNIFAYR